MRDPDRLGKYRIDAIIGEGGMGVIYRGYDEDLEQPVAIKTIRPGLLKGRAGRELQERFLREAKAQIRLHHPNIVPIFEFQPNGGGMPFFAMEYVEGKSLKEYLTLGMHCNLDLSLHIVTQVLDALSFSHRKGIVHRDIKPANILLLEDDYYSVKIVDFGIARIDESEYTQTGKMIGTPQYLSPEQSQGKRVDARSDLYSTALVWYELLTGEKLFSSSTDVKAKHRVTDEHLHKLDIYPAETQKILKAVLVRALATEPDKRFQTASDFSAALQPMLKKPEPVKSHGTLLIYSTGIIGILVLAAAYFLSQSDIPWPNLPPRVFSSTAEPSPRVDLTAEEQKNLKDRLKRGDLHLAVGRLIFPEGSNATYSYRRAQEIDPGNPDARRGLETVQENVLVQLQQLQAQNRLQDMCDELALARRLFPDNSAFKELREESQCPD